MKNLAKKTQALHAGHDTGKTQQTRAVPIYLSSSYVFNSTEHASNLFDLKEEGYIYSRINNPTNDVLEQRLANVEGGIAGLTFASGTAAIASTLLTLLKTGDHIVASSSLYGGTYTLLDVTLRRFGINTTFVDADEVPNFQAAIRPNTKAIFAESLGNPKIDVLDLEGIAAVAQTNGVPFIVDNTVATPVLLNPILFGANLVIHSLTKYIGGNGTALGGAVVDAGNFNWANGNFPELTEPTKAYHGLSYHQKFGDAAFAAKLRLEGLRDFGSALSPQNAFQIIQGLETLDVRIRRHSENALKLAQWLENHNQVAWVNYAGLKSSKYYALAQKYLPEGQSGIISFGLKGGFDAARKVADSVQLISLLANIGDSKSLIIHPGSTTHRQLTAEQQKTTGVTPDLIRFSVGLEDVEDIKADLQQAIVQ